MTDISSAAERRRVLVLEDEYLLARELSEALEADDYEVVGPLGSLTGNILDIETVPLDAAIVDLNLRGKMAFNLIDKLERLGVPVVIVTGYAESSLPKRYAGIPHLQKPAKHVDILKELEAALGPQQ